MIKILVTIIVIGIVWAILTIFGDKEIY